MIQTLCLYFLNWIPEGSLKTMKYKWCNCYTLKEKYKKAGTKCGILLTVALEEWVKSGGHYVLVINSISNIFAHKQIFFWPFYCQQVIGTVQYLGDKIDI